MTDSLLDSNNAFSLEYRFNEREIKILAKLLRNHQEELPEALIDFSTKIEQTIYNSMSIDEASAFYS